MHYQELLDLIEKRLEAVREEKKRAARSVTEHSSPGHVMGASITMHECASVDLELSRLLRLAHGMNGNGIWPHPEGSCIYCGRETEGKGALLCTHPTCKERHQS